MALSNAQRQRRFRQRRETREQAARAHDASEIERLRGEILHLRARNVVLKMELERDSAKLSPAQIEDRGVISCDEMFPFPQDRSTLPRFMGWDRLDWVRAPDEMVRHFDMTEAVEGWREALAAHPEALPKAHRAG